MSKDTSGKRLRYAFLAALLSTGLLGSYLLLRSTPYGLGLVNDSAAYIGGAANLLQGNGYTRLAGDGTLQPITHFPPLFSMLLAAVSLAGPDLFQAARALIVVLFVLDIILVGLAVYKIGRSAPFALLGALLLAASDIHLNVYAFALSEPLYISLMLLVFLSFAEYIDSRRWPWLALSGLGTGLAYLTRYVGLSLGLVVVLALLLLTADWQRALFQRRESKGPLKIPAKEAAVLLAGGLPPAILWGVYTLSVNSGIGNRLFAWHPISLNALSEGMKNLLSWLAPDALLAVFPVFGRTLSGLSLLLLPALAVWLIWTIRRQVRGGQDGQPVKGGTALATALALHIWAYIGFLVVSISIFDASTPLDSRILSIVYVPLMILFAALLSWFWQAAARFPRTPGAGLKGGILVLCAGLIFTTVGDGLDEVEYLSRDGQGFANSGLRESTAIQAIRETKGVKIYTNKPTAVYLLTGKAAHITPSPSDAVTLQPRPGYQADLEKMQQEVRDGEALLVIFDLHRSSDAGDVALFEILTEGLELRSDHGHALIFGSK